MHKSSHCNQKMFYSRIDSYNRKNVQLGASQHWQMTQTLQPCGFVVVPNLPKLSLRGPQLKNFETPPLSPKITPSYPIIPQKKTIP